MRAKTSLNARILVSTIALLFVSVSIRAQTQTNPPPDPPKGFDKIEQMVPMRDGVKLHTIIYAPKSPHQPLPIIFNRTPYGIDNIYRGFASPSSLQELIDEGFIFAFQDIRGKFKSEGQFIMGYHRLLTHRGYKTPKLVEYFLSLCGTLAFEGGPINWVVTHRIHHAHTDAPGDPHTPRDGGWWAHMIR